MCANAFPSCLERVAKGKSGMAEMPHKCGPIFMGFDWKEDSGVKMRSESERVRFVESESEEKAKT